jgi:hypothetical protein
MTYSIFDGNGNLMDAFDDHDAAVAALGAIVKADPKAADAVFLAAQDNAGRFVGDAMYGSSLRVAA